METACPGENHTHHSSHGRLIRLGRFVLITLKIPNNIQFKDGAQVFKLGTYLAFRVECKQLTMAYRGCTRWLAASQTRLVSLSLSNHSFPVRSHSTAGSLPSMASMHLIPSAHKGFSLAVCMVKTLSDFRVSVLREGFTEHTV